MLSSLFQSKSMPLSSSLPVTHHNCQKGSPPHTWKNPRGPLSLKIPLTISTAPAPLCPLSRAACQKRNVEEKWYNVGAIVTMITTLLKRQTIDQSPKRLILRVLFPELPVRPSISLANSTKLSSLYHRTNIVYLLFRISFCYLKGNPQVLLGWFWPPKGYPTPICGY